MTNSASTLALLFAGLVASATAAQAHAKLDHSVPAASSTINTVPNEVVLSFTEQIEPKFSGAEVLDSKGAHVDETSSASGTSIHVKLKPLTPGAYQVKWHALSEDTHKTKGSFTFTVTK
jgi:methionine-rich copper-binding protein CopC